MSFEVKPELDSGFFICGAPVIVAPGVGEDEAAATGNVGLALDDLYDWLDDVMLDDDWNYQMKTSWFFEF